MIEKPFRNVNIISKLNFMKTIAISAMLIIIFGYFGYKSDGYSQQMIKYKFSNSENERYEKVFAATNYDM